MHVDNQKVSSTTAPAGQCNRPQAFPQIYVLSVMAMWGLMVTPKDVTDYPNWSQDPFTQESLTSYKYRATGGDR